MEESEKEHGLPAIYSKDLVYIAEQAEKRIEAIIKIKKVALRVTNKFDWTNQNDRPYLQVSGSEKVANLFNISWRIDEPRMETEDDGNFTYTYKGEFSLVDRTVEVEGSRSSKDPFFKKYDYSKDSAGKTIKTEKPISAIDKRDVKMAALTNLLGNGISRILGIRNLQWSDLEEFAGIKKEEVNEIQYRKGGDKPPIQEPQKKSNGTPPPAESGTHQKITAPIEEFDVKKGIKDGKPWMLYSVGILQEGKKVYFRTFSETLAKLAETEKGTGMPMEITWEMTEKGNRLLDLVRTQREPGSEG